MSDVRFHPKALNQGPMPPLHAERLYGMLGTEQPLHEVARALRHYAQSEKPPAVGAALVTCADEAERELVEAFERDFVRYLLPQLKLSSRAEFRLANLGGRYEWGAARVAEDHYAQAPGASDWKLMVVKINAHVALESTPAGPVFGRIERYTEDSTYCGALHATLDGSPWPFARELTETFGFEGVDRLATLRDPKRVPPEHKALFAAVVSARLQARRAMLDVQDYHPASPTLWLILPCVTLNKRERDTEIVCGLYTADRRGGEAHDEYCGLSASPERYRLGERGGQLTLEDPGLHEPRRARDHRKEVERSWEDEERPEHPLDPRLREATREAQKKLDTPYAKAALKGLLEIALLAAPVPAAVVLFGEGLIGIHHASKAHKLAREARGDAEARAMLREVQDQIEALPPEKAKHLVALLLEQYAD